MEKEIVVVIGHRLGQGDKVAKGVEEASLCNKVCKLNQL